MCCARHKHPTYIRAPLRTQLAAPGALCHDTMLPPRTKTTYHIYVHILISTRMFDFMLTPIVTVMQSQLQLQLQSQSYRCLRTKTLAMQPSGNKLLVLASDLALVVSCCIAFTKKQPSIAELGMQCKFDWPIFKSILLSGGVFFSRDTE